MIQSNELRIENYVLDSYNGKITRINWQEIKWIQEVTDRYAPIELTEEILLNCGFEKETTFYVIKNFFEIKINNGYYIRYSTDLIEKEIKYLHQLQNIYFALTNEELNVKL